MIYFSLMIDTLALLPVESKILEIKMKKYSTESELYWIFLEFSI